MVGLRHLHAAIPHPMLHVAAPEENQARLEFRFVGDECHIRLHRLTRPVQIPCRFFWQVIDSAYLCRTRTDNIKTLYLLFTYCYDVSVILSKAKDLCTFAPGGAQNPHNKKAQPEG